MKMLKDVFLGCLSVLALPADRAVILMYHSVREEGPLFNVTPAAFARQMAYLKHKKYDVVSLRELVRRLRTREPLGRVVVITFDDGYRDNYTHAFPILQQYRFPATIFSVTDAIGSKTNEHVYLGVEEMNAMRDTTLIDIEPHTRTHPHLSRLSPERQREEINGSKEALERLLGTPCTLFAYPYGDFTDETARIANETGYEAAVTVREGTVGSHADLLRLPRVSIDASTTDAQFRGKCSRAVDLYEALKRYL